MSSRASLGHSLLVVVLTASVFLVCRYTYFVGIRSSDGANYATVARNHVEGRGLLSSVIQPGLIGVVPSGPGGQAFVTQAPLWPLLLSGAFRLLGSSEATLLAVSGALLVLIMLEAWWLTFLITRQVAWSYLVWAFVISNPFIIGTSLAGANVMLQASLLGAIFLLAWAPPNWWRGVLMGILLGAACVTRENSLFAAPGVAFMWHRHLCSGGEAGKKPATRRWYRFWLPDGRTFRVWTLAVAGVLVLAFVPIRLEAARKAAVLGRADAPVLRMTFLYYTPVADQGWYFIYDHPMLRINPKDYFLARPFELIRKMWYQVKVLFLKETVPALLSFFPWFVPVLVPPWMGQEKARSLGYGLLATLGIQVVVASAAILNFIYFFAFLPLLGAGIGATLTGIWMRLRTHLSLRGWRFWTWSALGAYAVTPLLLNVALLAAGVRPGTGDYHLTASAERDLARFIVNHTGSDAVVASSHSALLAWDTRRTVVMYSGHPQYTIGDTPMWRAINEKVRIDYILLTTLAYESLDRTLLPGFSRVASLKTREGVEAWLFAGPGRGKRACRSGNPSSC